MATANVCFSAGYDFFQFALPSRIQFVKTKLRLTFRDHFSKFRNFLKMYVLIIPRNISE